METKVLLVDDEEQFVELLSGRLETRGFTVAVACSGDEAIEVLEKQEPDVVILDVLMPGQDGIDTLREIKQLRPLTEVIMLTGHGTVDSAIQGMRLGAYDYLMKPTDTKDLVDKITSAKHRKAEHEQRIKNAEVERIVQTRGW
jgi:two-component system, OmpR family, response regulator CpxR